MKKYSKNILKERVYAHKFYYGILLEFFYLLSVINASPV